jgi:hypothetical protein
VQAFTDEHEHRGLSMPEYATSISAVDARGRGGKKPTRPRSRPPARVRRFVRHGLLRRAGLHARSVRDTREPAPRWPGRAGPLGPSGEEGEAAALGGQRAPACRTGAGLTPFSTPHPGMPFQAVRVGAGQRPSQRSSVPK